MNFLYQVILEFLIIRRINVDQYRKWAQETETLLKELAGNESDAYMKVRISLNSMKRCVMCRGNCDLIVNFRNWPC